MLTIQEQTIVNASSDTVFNVITELETYKEWNPWIVEASGIPEEGQLVEVKVITLKTVSDEAFTMVCS